MELYQMTASELCRMLEKREISSAELTRSVFSRIKDVEGKVKAYITLCEEQAIQKAEEVDQKRAAGETLSKMAGIPIGVKDNVCTKDILTTCASKMLYNFVPPYDATVMKKIHAADMVLLGKLNMDEFAMGSSTETSYFHTTCNPVDLTRVPGGSSGGSAAAVAAGEAVCSIGSDTGGSIRQPAACCGVVGLKPTYGAVSRYGLIAFASSLDQIGPFGRCVDDAALLYEVISGHDPLDATSEVFEPFCWEDRPADLSMIKGLKVAVPKEYYGEGVDEENRRAAQDMVQLLRENGAEIVEISLPSTGFALSAYYIISSAEASSNLARFDGVRYGYRSPNYSDLVEMYENTRSEGFGMEVQRRILLGTFVLSSGYYDAYYKRAKLLQKQIVQEFEQAFSSCDVILTPTVPTAAFRIGAKIDNPNQMHASDRCTVAANIAGLPAISLPCKKNQEGLPLSVQFFGKHFSEGQLLRLAKCCETMVGRMDMPALTD